MGRGRARLLNEDAGEFQFLDHAPATADFGNLGVDFQNEGVRESAMLSIAGVCTAATTVKIVIRSVAFPVPP